MEVKVRYSLWVFTNSLHETGWRDHISSCDNLAGKIYKEHSVEGAR